MSNSSGAEHARSVIKDISKLNVDDLVKISSFSPECMQGIVEHIGLEYKSWYAFKKLAMDCSRSNIALHGFSMFFARAAAECMADAIYMEKYLIQRGGMAKPMDIPASKISWGDNPIEPLGPLQECLKMEREILEDVQRLYGIADKTHDYALQETISRRFLEKETKHVKDMGDMLQEVARVAKVPGHGLYHIDKELRMKLGKTPWSMENKPQAGDYLLRDVAQGMTSESPIQLGLSL